MRTTRLTPVQFRSYCRQVTITRLNTVPVRWSPGCHCGLWQSIGVALEVPLPCVAPWSPWRRLSQRSCGPQGRGTRVYCRGAGTPLLFCVPCVGRLLGPWMLVCPVPGGGAPERCVSVCPCSSSFPPAQTGAWHHTWAGAPGTRPSSRLGGTCRLHYGLPG